MATRVAGKRETRKVSAVLLGARGDITLPQRLRQEMKLGPGSVLVVEATEEGILLRLPADVRSREPGKPNVEEYTQQRLAEFREDDAATPAELRKLRRRARA